MVLPQLRLMFMRILAILRHCKLNWNHWDVNWNNFWKTVSCLSSKIDHLTALLQTANNNNGTSVTGTHNATVAPDYVHLDTNGAKQSDRTNYKPHNQSSQDAVTAMYVDLRRKQQRSNNIVITGLQNSDNDAAFVTESLKEEFSCDTELWPGVSVAWCQRLGKQQDNKLTAMLLVTLDSRDQAEYYIKNASYRRSSNNQEVKSNVYINADLDSIRGQSCLWAQNGKKTKAVKTDKWTNAFESESEPIKAYAHLLQIDIFSIQQWFSLSKQQPCQWESSADFS